VQRQKVVIPSLYLQLDRDFMGARNLAKTQPNLRSANVENVYTDFRRMHSVGLSLVIVGVDSNVQRGELPND
jgi:hypothetical protein